MKWIRQLLLRLMEVVMDLNDLVFHPIQPAPLPAQAAPPVKDAEVEEDDAVVCPTCKVEGSMPLPNGTCDTCGQAWVFDDDEDDFSTALNLLQKAQIAVDSILTCAKLVNKMSMTRETELRDLAMSIDDFLEGYEQWNEEGVKV